jgi:outer membrane protein TolC
MGSIQNNGHDSDLAQNLVSLQEQMKAANDKLIAAGRAPLSSRQTFEAQLWRLKSAMPVFEARRKTAGYRLAALLGEIPEKLPPEAMLCRQVPLLQKPFPTGDGKGFLARRPDVRQAEAAAKAASARIGVALGDLYPHVTLGIAAGSTGLLSHFGQGDTYKYSFGPLISWDFPERAAVKARIRGAEAVNVAALANFDAVVVNALRDGETALSIYARDLDQNSALTLASADRARARSDSEALYARGRQSLMEKLEARRAHLLAEQELAASQAKLAGDQVILFWVFGGGW